MGDSDEIIRRLKKEGWHEVSHTGSHKTFKKAGMEKLVTVPHPRKDIGRGLKRAIWKAAGWL